ncbi:MAG: EamA family transporter [Dehalococcoidia bacterium]
MQPGWTSSARPLSSSSGFWTRRKGVGRRTWRRPSEFGATFSPQVGAVRASVATYLMPPIAIGLGWLLLDEPLEWPMAAGLVCIILGVALAQGIALGWVSRRSPVSQPSG